MSRTEENGGRRKRAVAEGVDYRAFYEEREPGAPRRPRKPVERGPIIQRPKTLQDLIVESLCALKVCSSVT